MKFSRLFNAISFVASKDVDIGQLMGGKEKKHKGFFGLVGIGGKKSKQKDLAHTIQAIQRQAQDANQVNRGEEEIQPEVADDAEGVEDDLSNADGSSGRESL